MTASKHLLESDLDALEQARKCIRAGEGWVSTRITPPDEYSTRQIARLISELHQCLNTLEAINNRVKEVMEGNV